MNKRFHFDVYKNLIFLLLFCCGFSACGQPSLENKRKETMAAIINAIIKNDTIQIFKLVDTGYVIKLNEKDGFMRFLRILHKELSANKIHSDYDGFVSKPGIANTTDYTIRCYLSKSKYKYIDLKFSFNPKWYNQVYNLNANFGPNEMNDNKPIILIRAPENKNR